MVTPDAVRSDEGLGGGEEDIVGWEKGVWELSEEVWRS